MALALIFLPVISSAESDPEPDSVESRAAITPVGPDAGSAVESDAGPTAVESDRSPPAVALGRDSSEPGGPGEAADPDEAAAASVDDEWEDDWDDWNDELELTPMGYPDPFEPVNRVILSFNNGVDALVLDPVTRLYRFVLPDFARQSILRIFANVNSPQVMVNDALQLEWPDAGIITSRLLVNSTVGVGGIFDVAEPMGLQPHESGFGQTLALAGLPPGTYLVLPLLGPSNMRDALGTGVDSLMHPTFYVLGGTDLLIFGGSAGLTTRSRHFEELQALKDSSVDVYSALRSGYYQNRQAEIWGRREDRRGSTGLTDEVAYDGAAGE